MTDIDIPAIRALIKEARNALLGLKEHHIANRLADALESLLALVPEPATERKPYVDQLPEGYYVEDYEDAETFPMGCLWQKFESGEWLCHSSDAGPHRTRIAEQAVIEGRMHRLVREPEPATEDELRDAIDHIQGAVDFQDAINPEAVRVVIDTALGFSRPIDREHAFERFVESFNGDEAGDIDLVQSYLGDTGWAMRGGNDVRAVFEKAVAALQEGSK